MPFYHETPFILTMPPSHRRLFIYNTFRLSLVDFNYETGKENFPCSSFFKEDSVESSKLSLGITDLLPGYFSPHGSQNMTATKPVKNFAEKLYLVQ